MTLDRERPPARHRRFAWRISGILILLALHVGFVPTASAQSQMTWALQVSLVPAWFDPGEFSPVQTSLVVQARKLLAEAGYPNGFDAGDFNGETSAAGFSEAVVNDLGAVGIRTKLRLIERAAFLRQWRERRFQHSLVFAAGGAFGNAALRIENSMVRGSPYVYGSYPDVDDLFSQQAREHDPTKRAALLECSPFRLLTVGT